MYSRLLGISAAVSNEFKTTATRSSGAAGTNNLYLSLAPLPGVHKLLSRPLELSAAAAGKCKTIAARSSGGRGKCPVIFDLHLALMAKVNKLLFMSFLPQPFVGRGKQVSIFRLFIPNFLVAT